MTYNEAPFKYLPVHSQIECECCSWVGEASDLEQGFCPECGQEDCFIDYDADDEDGDENG
mgnify:FL=1